MFEGYHNAPEGTAAVTDAEGWFHTGDVGVVDEGGRISYLGRLKDMLKVGGENVAAAEIEEALQQHPAVNIAQVVGIPDDRLVEVPVAVIELRAGQRVTGEELGEWCTAGSRASSCPATSAWSRSGRWRPPKSRSSGCARRSAPSSGSSSRDGDLVPAAEAGAVDEIAGLVTRFDHVAVAVRDLAVAAPLYTDLFGGRLIAGGDDDRLAIRSLQLSFLPGVKIELLQPLHEQSYLAAYLERLGPGFHHMTCFVDDVTAAAARLEADGFATVDTRTGTGCWDETFIRPSSGFGTLVQLTDSSLTWTEGNEVALRLAEEHFGRVDAVVLSAGITAWGHVESLDFAVYDRVMDVNVRAGVLGIRAAAPALRRSGGGSIVVLSSVSGTGGEPEHWAYCTSKAAITNLARSAAVDLAADGIRVNVVAPGPTHTDLTRPIKDTQPERYEELRRSLPLQRWGEQEEVAEAIAFLASPASSSITAAVLPVDGGATGRTAQLAPPQIGS